MPFVNARKQQGVVLIVGLVMLLLLTIVGLAGVRDSTMQEKMAGGLRDKQVAFQAAEAGLRAGEELVSKYAVSSGTAGYIETTTQAGLVSFWELESSWANEANLGVAEQQLGQVVVQPSYVFEILSSSGAVTEQVGKQVGYGQVDETMVYRITARGWGTTDTAEAILQTMVEKQM